MESKQIIFDVSHLGKHTFNVEELGYKALVITGAIQGKKDPSFGRLIQVRKKSGAFGSDTVLLRESDGVLRSYHNMSFYTVAEDFVSLYEAAMKEVDEKNADKIEHRYDIQGENEATGFVVHGLDDTKGETYSFGITISKES
jgi:hypothetical protein